jgi:hypothetical protein
MLDEGHASEAELARVLVVSARGLHAFESGKTNIPLDRQPCVALFMLDSVP